MAYRGIIDANHALNVPLCSIKEVFELMSEHSNALTRRAFVGGAAMLGASAAITGISPQHAYGVTATEKKAEAAAALEKLDAMRARLAIAEGDFERATSEQLAAQALMDESQAKIDDANARISELQGQLGDRAKSMYRNGSLSFVDLLLGATSFQAFTTNWGLLNDMNENDAVMVQQTKELRAEVEEQQQVYSTQERVASQKADQAKQVQEESQALVNEVQATYESLSAEAEQLVAAEEKAREEESARQAQQDLAQIQSGASGNSGNKNPSSSGTTNGSGNKNPSSSGGSTAAGDSLPSAGSTPVQRAYAMIGKPYVTGGVGPNSFDCSGFLGYCYTGQYKRIGTTYDIFARQPNVSNPQPGDFVWSWDHVGLYIGNGRMIHASSSKGKVIEAAVYAGLTYKRWRG